jgi:predicted XRE-type DNA-binding protein
MTSKTGIPDTYFDEEQFLVNEINEDEIIGILGVRPSPEQVLKFELCKIISNLIRQKGYSNNDAGKITGNDASDISRLLNYHIDRFTIERLLKTLTFLEGSKYVWKSMAKISEQIEKWVDS